MEARLFESGTKIGIDVGDSEVQGFYVAPNPVGPGHVVLDHLGHSLSAGLCAEKIRRLADVRPLGVGDPVSMFRHADKKVWAKAKGAVVAGFVDGFPVVRRGGVYHVATGVLRAADVQMFEFEYSEVGE